MDGIQHMSQVITIQPVRQQHLTAYTGPLSPLTDADNEFFQTRYGIVVPRIWRGDYGMYAMPIMPPTGAERRGVVLRRPWEGSPLYTGTAGGKKALTYQEKRGPLQAFYRAHGGALYKPLVVVEDQLSAMKVAEVGFHAVALLGVPGETGELGADRVRELSTFQCDEVIMALDADATARALLFARKWGYSFKKLRVAILPERDLKDTPKAEISEILGC